MLKGPIRKNALLSRDVQGYFNTLYYSMHDERNAQIKCINFLKNDFREFDGIVSACEKQLAALLAVDFAAIVRRHGPMTVCGIPRSKREANYPSEMMGLKRGIRLAVAQNAMLKDGLDYIVRHTNTKCTHWARYNRGGDGPMPYAGITRDTCTLSPEIAGKNILLVDDIYTPTCGIDEDAIEALFAAGAKSVIFYAVGYTVKKTAIGLCA